jgi:hypothetical protein
MEKQLLTSREAATYIGVSEGYLRALRCAGQVKGRLIPPPFVRVGKGRGGVRYVKVDLDTWIADLKRCRSLNEEE